MKGKPLESFHQRGTSSDLHSKITSPGNSLVVWWLRLCAFTAESQGFIPDGGNKVLKTVQHGQKKKEDCSSCWVAGGQKGQGQKQGAIQEAIPIIQSRDGWWLAPGKEAVKWGGVVRLHKWAKV